MQFKLESFHNPYLSPGANRVDSVLTVTASGGGAGGAPVQARPSVVGLIVDTSGSMQYARIDSVKYAVRQVIQMLDENQWFFVVSFCHVASVVYPVGQANAVNKANADAAVRRLEARGGTSMSTGLATARAQFAQVPDAIHQAIFLTDGKNGDEDELMLTQELARCDGAFQCECRGVGTDWQVRQLQTISQRLLGSAKIIAEPAGIEADFKETLQSNLTRAVGDVRLRLWTPKSAKIVAVKQMSPEIVPLTDRRVTVDGQTGEYPTGAWGSESRDYYVAVEFVSPGDVGDEMLACRPSVVYTEGGQLQEFKPAEGRILATWTPDEALSTRINVQVAHYTGQEELADAIQKGLEARANGDAEVATRLLGKAAKLAQESGNEDTTRRLRKVVDIVDADEGTVRLKQTVNKADEMDLDLGSTRTSRVSRS
ncbi:MAG: vWA domain-containing protein [Capsulimonadaceae bacterium]